MGIVSLEAAQKCTLRKDCGMSNQFAIESDSICIYWDFLVCFSCLSVCLNAQILVIIKAKVIKFGMPIAVCPQLLKYIENLDYHGHSSSKSVICVYYARILSHNFLLVHACRSM